MHTHTDIRGLVSDESIINDVVPEAFHDYNTQQMLTVDNGGKWSSQLLPFCICMCVFVV